MPRTRRDERPPLPAGFWTIWSTVALDLVGFGIIVPVLGRYAERFGASGLQVGLLFASFSVAQLVCAPLLGKLSDRVGRKPVILLSLAGTAVGSFVTGAAGALWVLFLGRIIDGASGASVAVAQGAVADLAPPAERPRLLGLLSAAFGIGFVLGPAIGGLAAVGGPHVPFYVAAVLAAVNLVAAWVRLPETCPVHHGEVVAAPPGAEPSVGRRPAALVRLAVAGFVAMLAFSGFEATFALFGDERFGLTEGSTSALFLLVGVVLVGVQGGAIHPLSVRLGSARLLVAGFGLVAGGLLSLAAATTWPLLIVALVLLSIGQGVVSPSIATLVASTAGEARRGEALGYQQSATALARVIGPPVAGLLFDHVGVAAPYVFGAVLSLVAIGVLLADRRGVPAPATG